jgi:chromosome condensin MukBEF ATPase and DNA-binding subunit MukB
VETVAGDLEWDLRVFDERRESLTYVCETPALIEQRLFALARVIQRSLE